MGLVPHIDLKGPHRVQMLHDRSEDYSDCRYREFDLDSDVESGRHFYTMVLEGPGLRSRLSSLGCANQCWLAHLCTVLRRQVVPAFRRFMLSAIALVFLHRARRRHRNGSMSCVSPRE